MNLNKIKKELNIDLRMRNNKIYEIKFNFTPDDWYNLINKEGKWLGVCCANISEMREIFINTLREDGWMRSDDLESFVVCMKGHEFYENSPITFVKKVYDSLADLLNISREIKLIEEDDLEDPVELSTNILFNKVWRFCNLYGGVAFFSDFGDTIKDCATHNDRLFHILPVIKTLYKKLENTEFDNVKGWAIVNKFSNKLYNTRNFELPIFSSKKDAENLLNHWIKSNQVVKEDSEIRFVKVSLKNGIEFLEEKA